MERVFVALLALFIASSVFANNIDSLNNAANRLDNSIEKVELLIQLSELTISGDQLKSIKFAQQAESISQKISYKKGEGQANYQMLVAHYYIGNMDEALSKSEKASKIFKGDNKPFELAKTYHTTGKVYSFTSQYDKATEYIYKGLDIFKNINDPIWVADSYTAVGMMECQRESYKIAIPLIEKALPTYQKNTIKHTKSLIRAYILLGVAYHGLKDYNTAIDYNLKALSFAEATNDIYNSTVSKTNLGWVYYLVGAYDKALKYCNDGLTDAEKQNDNFSRAHNYKCLGAVHLKLNKFVDSKEQLTNALAFIHDLKIQSEEANIYQLFVELHTKQNDYKTALDYHEKYHQATDSALAKQKNQRISILEKRLATTTTAQITENEELTKDNFNLSLLLLIVGCLTIFTIIFSFKYYFRNEKNKASLASERKETTHTVNQLNNELQNFEYLASHDFKQNMRNIMSFAGLLNKKLKNKNEDKALIEYSRFVLKGAKQMNDILSSILDFSKLDDDDHTNLEVFSPLIAIERLNETMADLIHQQKAEIVFPSNLPNQMMSNERYLRLIFQHLITNGITYNMSKTPIVQINYEVKNKRHIFKVIDNGVGIEENAFERIFEKFKRLNPNQSNQGAGIGLTMVKKLVEALEGTIDLESKVGEGSTFIVTLPKY